MGGLARALFAGAAVLGIQDYFHYLLSAQSDSMLVTLCLAAIDMYLCGRLRWALWMRRARRLGTPGGVAVPRRLRDLVLIKHPNMRWTDRRRRRSPLFFWFGVPTITNGRPNVAGQLALRSPRECTTGKVACTINRFTALDLSPWGWRR